MEVKPGYKQTEVGVIPADWEVTTVGNEFAIQLGKMLDSEKNSGVLKPYLGNRAVQWGRIDLDGIGFIRLTPSDLRRFRLVAGDLLVCEGGEIGRTAIWSQPIDECYYQKALHRLRPVCGYNIRLMLNLMQQMVASGFLLNYVTQTSIAHLPKDKLENVPIPLPPLYEQEVIAEALSDANALIDSLEQLIAKKRQIKQGAMQELLRPKNGWIQKKLKLIAPLQRGFDLPHRLLRAGRYPVVYSNGILNYHKDFMVKGPGLVTGRSGTLGVVQFITEDFWPHNTTLWVTDFNGNEPKFIYYLYSHIQLGRFGTGSGVPTLNRNDVHDYTTTIPTTLPEQTAIAEILSDMDEEIAVLEAKVAKARLVKQGMMQELLTGRIRLV
jgi:type I restriction enzyme S subunit